MTNQPPTDPDAPITAAQPNLFDKPGDAKPSPFATAPDAMLKARVTSETIETAIAEGKLPLTLTPPGTEIKPPVTSNLLLSMLIDLPDDIYEYQKIYDTVKAKYDSLLSGLSFKALSTMMFPGKDDTKRIASNDKERDIAISEVILADDKMTILSRELDEARNDLTLAKNRFEGVKIAAQLLAGK